MSREYALSFFVLKRKIYDTEYDQLQYILSVSLSHLQGFVNVYGTYKGGRAKCNSIKD